MSHQILIIEDNPADQVLALEALKDSKWKSLPHVVSDANEALDFLTQKGRYPSAPRPDLIILDLNLPGLDGRVLIKKIRYELKIKTTPIVVLSSSNAAEDVRKCYELCASSYVQKPSELERFFRVVRDIEDYWFGVSTLHPERSTATHA